jgi:hypothetical protein
MMISAPQRLRRVSGVDRGPSAAGAQNGSDSAASSGNYRQSVVLLRAKSTQRRRVNGTA